MSQNSQFSIHVSPRICTLKSPTLSDPPPILVNYDCIDFYVDKTLDDELSKSSTTTVISQSCAPMEDDNNFNIEIEPLSNAFKLPLECLEPYIFTETLLISRKCLEEDWYNQ